MGQGCLGVAHVGLKAPGPLLSRVASRPRKGGEPPAKSPQFKLLRERARNVVPVEHVNSHRERRAAPHRAGADTGL